MAVEIELLFTGQLGTTEADIWGPPEDKSAIVKNIRLVNTDASDPATINLYVTKDGGTKRAILPIDVTLPAKQLLIDDDELTMKDGDQIRGLRTGAIVEIVISGILREVV